MLQVDRGNFAEQSHYADSPSSIGYNTTISAPHMVMVVASFDNALFHGHRYHFSSMPMPLMH